MLVIGNMNIIGFTPSQGGGTPCFAITFWQNYTFNVWQNIPTNWNNCN